MSEWRQDPQYALKVIVESLERLTLPAPEQTAWLRSARLPADELALDYELAMDTLWVTMETGLFDESLQAELQEIDTLLEEISGPENSDEWTDDGLANSPNWARVRAMAQHALSRIRELTLGSS